MVKFNPPYTYSNYTSVQNFPLDNISKIVCAFLDKMTKFSRITINIKHLKITFDMNIKV